MSPTAPKKRKLPPTSDAATPASTKKSKKTKTPAQRLKTSGKSKGKQNGGRRAVDAASLAWQDAGEEFFGGLQVIKGVDVVKNGDQVKFIVSETSQTAAQDDEQKEYDEDESFEGFGDDPVEGGDLDPSEAGDREAGVASAGSKAEGKSKKEAKEKKAKADVGSVADQADEALRQPAAQGNSFDALAGLDGEAEQGPVDVAAWAPLKLSPYILEAVARLGFAKPTAIQEKSIPAIIAGEDVIGKAQTGSGKTLAFGIPIIEKWREGHDDGHDDAEGGERTGPRAVVLSPTRELAKQIGDHFNALCQGSDVAPRICVITGGLSIQKQRRQLEKADIVIATPGRLWEVLDGDIKMQDTFSRIDFLVIDEADRLFKAGQFKEAEDIIGALDKKDPEADEEESDEDEELPQRQTLVFSATFDKNLSAKLGAKRKGPIAAGTSDEEKMGYLLQRLKFRQTPSFIDVNPVSQMAEGLREGLIECGAMEKDLYLYAVLVLNPARRSLVFANSISAVRRLTPLLQNLNLNALPLHSQMAQKARLRSLERFSSSNAKGNAVLVATDVAARGLDVDSVDQVVHYHVPRAADTYIHRSGRTARGDKKGVSVLLCSPEEVLPTRRLANKVHTDQAAKGNGKPKKSDEIIQSLPVDRRVVARLKPRVTLAKRLADATIAKEKAHGEESWLKGAAEDLGVDVDVEDLEDMPGGKKGRGGGRKKKQDEAGKLSKAEMGALRAALREELSKRVNLGVSERYITGGRVDVGALLKEREQGMGMFLGGGDGLGLGLSI